MGTEYCDRYTYQQVYGHPPPEDGIWDPALGAPPVTVGGLSGVPEPSRAVEKPKRAAPKSRTAQSK